MHGTSGEQSEQRRLSGQRAGAGIRSLTEPSLDTTSEFAEIDFAILGVAAKLKHRLIKEHGTRPRRCEGEGRQIRTQAEAHPAPAARGDQAARRGRGNAALDRPQLKCQRADDFEAGERRMKEFRYPHRVPGTARHEDATGRSTAAGDFPVVVKTTYHCWRGSVSRCNH